MKESLSIYERCRFLKEIISFTAWFYYRLNASLRDTQKTLAQRGIDTSHETIRLWSGLLSSSALRKRQPRRGDKWHLDELCLRINGPSYWLWRVIDQEGFELDTLFS